MSHHALLSPLLLRLDALQAALRRAEVSLEVLRAQVAQFEVAAAALEARLSGSVRPTGVAR